MKQTDFAILLHRISYSESSLIVSYYTKSRGIQKFLYQGGKKKASALFPLNICEIVYYQRLDSELGKLTEVQSVLNLDGILTHPVKSTIAFFIADILKQTLQTNQSEEQLFEFLCSEIQLLNSQDQLTLFPIHFLAKYTEFIGIAPQIIENPRYFNLMEGEFHSDFRPGELEIDPILCAQLLAVFEHQDPDKKYRKELFDILLHYYKIHTPKFDISQSLQVISEILYD